MNYRHHFHAGNFADVVKHAVLLALLSRLTGDGPPLELLDTHAGAGVYDLSGEAARRSGEAQAGIGRLLADAAAPASLAPLAAAVRGLNRGGPPRLYPGSPWLAVQALRPGDRFVGCELRPDDHASLQRALQPLAGRGPVVTLEQADGFVAAIQPPRLARSLLLLDPPYERGDDYPRILQALAGALARRRRALVAAVWAPLKDFETFDALLRGVEALPFDTLAVAQVRLRALGDPMRLNGCAMVLLGAGRDAPAVLDIATLAEATCRWSAAATGEAGALGRVDILRA